MAHVFYPDGVDPVSFHLQGPALAGRIRAEIRSGGCGVWTGQTGETAKIGLDGPAELTIIYHSGFSSDGGRWRGVIDPSKGREYLVTAVRDVGKFSLRLRVAPR